MRGRKRQRKKDRVLWRAGRGRYLQYRRWRAREAGLDALDRIAVREHLLPVFWPLAPGMKSLKELGW